VTSEQYCAKESSSLSSCLVLLLIKLLTVGEFSIEIEHLKAHLAFNQACTNNIMLPIYKKGIFILLTLMVGNIIKLKGKKDSNDDVESNKIISFLTSDGNRC